MITIAKKDAVLHSMMIDRLFLYGPAILVFIFNISFFNRYFPLNSGWGETYGYLVNRGLIPFKDFHVSLPPFFFVFLNTFYLKFISGDFLALRFIGVIFYSLTIFLLQIFLEKFFDRKSAAVTVVLVSFLEMSESIYIAEDYRTYLELFVVLSLIFGQKFIRSRNLSLTSPPSAWSFKLDIYLLILGAITAITALTKQNVGLFLFLSYGLCIAILPSCFLRKKLMHITSYCVGFVAVFFLFSIYLSSLGVPHSFDVIRELFFANDSKGSGYTVLLRFLTNRDIISDLIASFLFLAVYLLLVNVPFNLWDRLKKCLIAQEYKEITNYLFVIALFLFAVLFNYSRGSIYWGMIIPVSLFILWFLFLEVYFIRRNDKALAGFTFVLIPLLSLTYSNTHTSGLSFSGMLFVIAFSCAYLLNRLLTYTTIKPVWFYLLLLCVLPLIVANKYSELYNWWGFSQSGINKAINELDYPATKGIYVDTTTKEAFNLISDSIKKYSKSDSDVYLFPHIPIFYYLHHKVPPYKNVIQWFDVISSKEIEEELKNFKANPPKVIVFIDPPDSVYGGHANLIKKPLVQVAFREEFERYDLSQYYILDNKRTTYKGQSRLRKIAVKNERFINNNLRYLYDVAKKDIGDFTVMAIIKSGVYMDKINEETLISKGDIIIMSVDDAQLKKVAEAIGYLEESDEYSIKIYIRKEPAPHLKNKV